MQATGRIIDCASGFVLVGGVLILGTWGETLQRQIEV